ncbi:NAD-dependent epimerase/dehydratase family protein [Candidatus Dependentiae bacterium]|nr:NAD-dependent epimerase/dehydratase family protein [Candidatus Dependentiae bacterium]
MKILITYPESFLSKILIETLSEQYKLITDETDYLKLNETEKIIKISKPDLIILHSPFSGGIKLNIEKPADLIISNNIVQTNVIKTALDNGINHLFFIGSSCMYPKNYSRKLCENDLFTGPLEETNSGYATSKICGWQMCKAISMQYKKKYITLIPANLFGEYDDFNPESAHVISSLIIRFHNAKINSDNEVTVWGTGSPVRDFLYAYDFAKAVKFLIENSCVFNEINIGSGNGNTISEIAETVKKAVEFKGKLIFDAEKPDGMKVKVLNTEKINKSGWSAATSLEQGIKNTYNWFLKNKDTQKYDNN